MKLLKTVLPYLITAILAIVLFKQCSKPDIVIETTINYEQIIDSLKGTIVIPEAIKDTIYLDSIIYRKSAPITLKGKDTIIYLTDTVEVAIITNRYDTKLESNNAVANLSIYTSGTLFKVDGTIEYQKETKTVKTTEFFDNNATYLYVETSILPFAEKFEVGIDRTYRNKFIYGASVEYDIINRQGFLNAKLGVVISRKK